MRDGRVASAQLRDEGILTFYELINTAQPGLKPVQKLHAVGTAYYGRRSVGVTRLYAAAGANRSIDVLVRCYNTPEAPETAEYAILENGKQYRIDAVQEQPELDAIDLTLVRLEALYDVIAETD